MYIQYYVIYVKYSRVWRSIFCSILLFSLITLFLTAFYSFSVFFLFLYSPLPTSLSFSLHCSILKQSVFIHDHGTTETNHCVGLFFRSMTTQPLLDSWEQDQWSLSPNILESISDRPLYFPHKSRENTRCHCHRRFHNSASLDYF